MLSPLICLLYNPIWIVNNKPFILLISFLISGVFTIKEVVWLATISVFSLVFDIDKDSDLLTLLPL